MQQQQQQSPKGASPERRPLSELGAAAMPVVSLGGAPMSIVDALHAALLPDIEDLVAFGRHERLTTATYLERNAGTKQISLLRRMARVSNEAGTSASRSALRGSSAPRFRLSSEVADDADAGMSLVDLGKLNDIKAVFTFAGAGMGGGLGKGMEKAEFIAKAAPVLCPNFPEGVATWYDTVDCDGSGSVNWPKLAIVLQELEPSAAFVGIVAAGEPMASVSDAGTQQAVAAGTSSPGVSVLHVPAAAGSASAFNLVGAPDSPSGMSVLGGLPQRGNSPTAEPQLSVPTLSTNAPTAEAAAYEEEAVRRYCELPRMSLRPANTAVTMVAICYSRRVLFAGCEDGAVRIFDLREPTLPVRGVIHHADNAKLLGIDYSEARGHLIVATTSGSIFAYDTTSTVATRTGNIIRAFHVTPVSAAECRTPWFTKKTLPYDPHRMPNAHVLGFSKRLDNRLAVIDVPAAFLTFGGHLSTGQHVLTALCQAPELAPPSAAIHADHLSPLIVGTAAGHVTCFRNICNGGLVPEDHAVAVTPAFSYRPHEASVSQVAFEVTNAVPCIYSSSLDGTFVCFDTRHEGLVWTFSLAPSPGAGRIGTPAGSARPGSSAGTRPASAAGVAPVLGRSFDHPITGFSISRRLGLIATINRSRSVCVWSAHSANRVLTLSDHPVPVVDVAFNDTHGHLVAASEDSALRVWDVRTGKLLQVITRPSTHSMVGGRSASSGGWSRSIAALCVDRDSHALIAMTCCPLIYDEELRATKVSAAGASWPESYHGHFDPVEHVTYAADMGAVLTADSRRVSVWKAAASGGHERISAFVPVEVNPSAASSYGATDHMGSRILGLTAMAGRECVLVWTASEVIVWRYRQPRAVRRFVGFAIGESLPDRVVPRAVLDLPPPHYLRQDGMNTAVVVTRTLVSIYFPATSASASSESAALHAVAVAPSATVCPTMHTADHKHEGLLETAAPVLGGKAFVVMSNCGDVFFITLADATKEPHVLACVLARKMETDCRLYTFDESASNAITSSSVTASRIGRYRPRTGDLWKRALIVASTERRLGSAGFTRFKHDTQQVLMSGTDFSVPLSNSHVLTFRGDGDALLWSFGEPTSRRRADGSWFCLHGSIPLTPELGACATGACFCRVTETLFVADTSGYLSVYSLDLGEVAHPQSDMDGKSFRLLRSTSGLDPRQFEGGVSPSTDVLVHAVGTRQYVIPVRAFVLVGCYFMCRDVVNALAPLPPMTTPPPSVQVCPRVLVGTEGTQSLAYRLDRSAKPPRLLVERALGDPRPALEPSWSSEHRYPWFMQKWRAGRGRSMRRDGSSPPRTGTTKPPRAAVAATTTAKPGSPTTFDAEIVSSPDHGPTSPEGSLLSLSQLNVESSTMVPPFALKVADDMQSLQGADTSSASPVFVAQQQAPRLRTSNRPTSRAVSRVQDNEDDSLANPAAHGPVRSVEAFLGDGPTGQQHASSVSDTADPSDKLLRLVSRRPYLARATGFRAPTPGSPPRAQSAEPTGVSSAALEYLQKTLTASNNDDVVRDAATSYRSLQLPGIPGDVERRLAEASAASADSDRALGAGGIHAAPRSRRGGPPRPLVALVEPAHRRRPATGGRVPSAARR